MKTNKTKRNKRPLTIAGYKLRHLQLQQNRFSKIRRLKGVSEVDAVHVPSPLPSGGEHRALPWQLFHLSQAVCSKAVLAPGKQNDKSQ